MISSTLTGTLIPLSIKPLTFSTLIVLQVEIRHKIAFLMLVNEAITEKALRALFMFKEVKKKIVILVNIV